MKAIKCLEKGRIELDTFKGFVMLAAVNHKYRSASTVGLVPNQARKLAGELIHLAHEAELKSRSAEGTSPVASPR